MLSCMQEDTELNVIFNVGSHGEMIPKLPERTGSQVFM